MFGVFLIVYLAMGLVSRTLIKVSPATPLGLLYALFFSHILGMIAPVMVYIYSKGFSFRETLSLRPVPLPSLLVISGISIVFFVTLHMLQGLMEPLFRPYADDMIAYQEFFGGLASASRSPANIFLLLLGVAVIPAVAEEMLFRGLILAGLKNSSTAARAIVLSSLLFGVIHVFPPQVISVSVLGIFFGILLVRTRSIVVTIWSHFLNNAMIILMMLVMPLIN
jgi:membrane protease YdiL (CAAX protease family)